MQSKIPEDTNGAQQAEGSTKLANGAPKTLLGVVLEWINSNPSGRQVLANVTQMAVALSPLAKVLASDAFVNEARRRFQEDGVPIEFDEAVQIAKMFMALRLPYTGKERSADADISEIRDYEIMSVYARREGRLLELIEESGTSPLAYKALQSAVKSLRRNGEPLPAELLEWSLDVAEGKRELPSVGPGRNPYSNQVRDELIVRTVQALVDCGLNATRNQATEPAESACDAVSEALKAHGVELGYDSVARIWVKGKTKTVSCQSAESAPDAPYAGPSDSLNT